MNKEFKKSFFMSLMAVLLVVSNLIGMKYTNFFDIIIGVDFVTFPLTFLCTLLIINYGDKKDAYRSILIASVIQLLITICYAFASSLGSQSLMPDSAMYVNELFKVNQLNILASVLAFIVSHCVLIYVYETFKYYGKELYGLFIGLLGSLVLKSFIYLCISLSEYDAIFVINLLLSNIIIDIIMVAIIIVLFYILKDKEVVEQQNIKPIPKRAVFKTSSEPKELKKEVKSDVKKEVKKPVKNYKKSVSNKTSTKKTVKKNSVPSKQKVKKTNK